MKTKQDAQEAAELLRREFGLAMPVEIKWTARERNGRAYAYPGFTIIEIGPNVWRGIEACFLHEFAHVLACRSAPLDLIRPHGSEYFQALVDIVRAWYGNLTAYPWDTEYRMLSRWAFQKGYSQKRRDPLPRRSRVIWNS